MTYTVLNQMPPDRVTDCDGRWYLRHAELDDGTDVFVVSARVPEGTRAHDLRPEALEIMPGDEWDNADPVTLPVDVVRALLEWPPAT